jgi:mono/diheme cytochrome c family protein
MRGCRFAAPLAAAFVAAGVLGACGGEDGGGGETQPPAAQTTQAPEEQPGVATAGAGREVFTQNCGSCHTLADAGTSGTVGPNLDELQPDAEVVERQVRNGGGGMPAFEGRLSDEQIQAVAEYVAGAAGR